MTPVTKLWAMLLVIRAILLFIHGSHAVLHVDVYKNLDLEVQ